jgi:hypothetical protein
MQPPQGRRRTTSNGTGKSTAVEDFARHSGKAAGKGVTERGKLLRWRILLVSQWKMSKTAGKEGNKALPPGRRGQGVGVRENTLWWRISSRYSVEYRTQQREQGVAERQNPLRRGMSLGYSERSRKNRSIRGFRCLSVFLLVYLYIYNLSVVMPGFA